MTENNKPIFQIDFKYEEDMACRIAEQDTPEAAEKYFWELAKEHKIPVISITKVTKVDTLHPEVENLPADEKKRILN